MDGYLKELDRDAPLIRERYIEIAAAKLAVSANEELGKETQKFDSQIASLSQFVAAYKQGGAAIAAADIGKQLEGDREKVAEARRGVRDLRGTEPENVTALAQLGSGLLQANAALDAHAEPCSRSARSAFPSRSRKKPARSRIRSRRCGSSALRTSRARTRCARRKCR